MAVSRLDIRRALQLHRQEPAQDPTSIALMEQMTNRRMALDSEMSLFNVLCDRWDNLYFPQGFAKGGASHWSNHESAKQPGRAHVSVNVYPVYVDLPAALQAVKPVENMVATDDTKAGRKLAAAVERVYGAWKDDLKYDMLCHKAYVTKGLYGRTASKHYWDADRGMPVMEIVDQPRNLYLGWKNSNYTDLSWAMYAYTITAETALEDWGLECIEGQDPDGSSYPIVINPGVSRIQQVATASMQQADLKVEVYDYWYRKPRMGARIELGKPVRFETWNAIFVGNVLVKNKLHREYRGKMPYIPLFNTYIPGVPAGRPEFYDIEQLIREKDERLSENAQMITKAINGQSWQWTGPTTGYTVPAGLEPSPNGIVAPGEGNRIEPIEPWMPEFQMEQFMSRLDRELNDVSGLNELLRGMAPDAVLNSGKAISALVANYEARITMKRDLAYDWRLLNWDMASTIWAEKSREMRGAIEGNARLVITNPNLTPRDDAEAASIARQLVDGKLISAKRGMDKVGVDDPETEQDIIREEQSDAVLNPAQVQVMAQLLGILQAQGIQPGGDVTQAVQGQANALADVRALAPGTDQVPSLNDPNAQPQVPPDQLPGNVEGSLGPQDVTLQTAIRGGEAQSRILQQQQLSEQTPSGG